MGLLTWQSFGRGSRFWDVTVRQAWHLLRTGRDHSAFTAWLLGIAGRDFSDIYVIQYNDLQIL